LAVTEGIVHRHVAFRAMLRWGILGPGAIAGGALAPAMRACGHDLAAVGSRSLTRAQVFAANHGVRRARGSYGDVITAADVDAVYVALPNDLHEPWTVAALEAGKHVLCEKPLATDAAGAGRMAAAAARSGRVLMEAVMSRFHPRTAALIDMLRGGDVGPVSLLHAAFTFPMVNADDYRTRPEHGGGALLDVGIYGVSMVRWLTGEEPDVVRAAQRTWPTSVDGTTAAVLGFPAGAIATVHASFDSASAQSLTVIGKQAVLQSPQPFTAGAGDEAVVLRDGQVIGTWQADPYATMVSSFAATVAGSAPAVLPPDDAVATASILDRIAAAATA